MPREPRFCYYIPTDAYIPGHGYRVSIVVEHEAGYRPTGTWPYTGAVGEALPYFWGHDYDDATHEAIAQNARMGLTERETDLIIASSMSAQVVEVAQILAPSPESSPEDPDDGA